MKYLSLLLSLASSTSATRLKPTLTLALASSGIGGLRPYSSRVEGACVCRVVSTFNPNCRAGLYINVNDHGNDWCWISRYMDRQACDDNELRGECEKADHEIHDWAQGVYSFRDTLLAKLVRDESVSLRQIAATKRAVSNALETLRNNLGLHLECTLGLQTQTLVTGTHSHCYSPELLNVCEHAKKKAPELYQGVTKQLEQLAADNENIHPGFVEAFKIGMEASDNTIDINCNVTAHNSFEISTSDARRENFTAQYLSVSLLASLLALGYLIN
mmetsp:Transcript_40748/g.75430  ORF Transcript_40748/g.75430 Transcript_40748/m.75430 type:complete len:273 (-) Transcript_40748:349-1167(-)